MKKLPLCKNEENYIFVECEVFVNFICDNVEGIKKCNVSRDLKVNTVLLEKSECVPIHCCILCLYNTVGVDTCSGKILTRVIIYDFLLEWVVKWFF